jgi:hypothetical protein
MESGLKQSALLNQETGAFPAPVSIFLCLLGPRNQN